MNVKKESSTDEIEINDLEIWELRLYVAGQTPNSMRAFANLQKICDEHLKGKCKIEVIDLIKNPRTSCW